MEALRVVLVVMLAAGLGSLAMSAAMTARALTLLARRAQEPLEVRVVVVDADTMIGEVEDHLRGDA